MRAPPGWADWLAVAGATAAVDAARGLHVNVADHALDAAVAGAGVSLSFKLIASDDVHSGRLVTPFGPELPLASSYNFVCPQGHETRPKVRAFRDWLFAEMAETKEKWRAVANAGWLARPMPAGDRRRTSAWSAAGHTDQAESIG